MNFQTMEYFIAVAQERNFTRAAERLHVTQQTLSSHIASVEKELGCQLIIRRVPLELTFAGRTFLRYANEFKKTVYTMKQELCDINNNQKGELRIGVGYTRSMIFMPTLISAFQQKHPNVRISVFEDNNLIGDLMDGATDLVINNLSAYPPEIETEEFYEEETVLVVSRSLLQSLSIDPMAVEASLAQGNLTPLKDCPFLIGTTGYTSKVASELFQSAGFLPIIKAQAININSLLSLCHNGMGACFSPNNMIDSMLPFSLHTQLHIFRLPNKYHYKIGFGYLKRTYQWSLIEEFIRISRENYPRADEESSVLKQR